MTTRPKKLPKSNSPEVRKLHKEAEKWRLYAIEANRKLTIFNGFDKVIRQVRIHKRAHEGCCIDVIENVLIHYGIIKEVNQ